MAQTTCPVFRPTEQEFKDFRRYIEQVIDLNAASRKAGLCKIIPPPGMYNNGSVQSSACGVMFVLVYTTLLSSVNTVSSIKSPDKISSIVGFTHLCSAEKHAV